MLRFFINNPIFSTVMAIIIVLCGLVSIVSLPLEEYPDITPPTLTLTAHYPGANAEAMERVVASPIEDDINGASKMLYMNSTMSSNGEYNLVITFETGTDLDAVLGDVLNRLNTALPILPEIVQQLGVTIRKSSQNLLMSISMISDGQYSQVSLSNFVYRTIYTELSRINGIGDIAMIGDRTYSMRIWLQPDKMTKLGVTVNQIESAILDQNIQVAVGQTGKPPTDGKAVLSFNLNGTGYYSNPDQFENIVISQTGVNYIRIKDVARVELGAQSYDTVSKLDRTETVGLQLYLDPGSNELAVHSEVVDAMEKMKRQLPRGVSYQISFDNTKFILQSLKNVEHTLFDAAILVILVVFLFLQKGKATLIPILTIPVSIIGSFAGMYLTGFSINNLTLFGLILSIGIVVDDSIVVIENVERIMREKQVSSKEASIQSMNEVATALIAIVLVLCCAFIPSAFLSGLTGILYRQFAITISIAVILSGVTALTLTPALCAIMLKNYQHKETKNKFFVKFNQGFEWLTDRYIEIVEHVIRLRKTYMVVFFMIILTTILIYIKIPIGFIPNEDKGFFTTQIVLPNNASLERTGEVTDRYVQYLMKNKAIDNSISLIGIDTLNSSAQKTNVATVISALIGWDDRKQDVEEIIDDANGYGAKQKDARFVAYNQPAINGLSNTNGIEFFVEDKVEGNYFTLQNNLNKIVAELEKDKAVKDAYFSFNANVAKVDIIADVDRASMYNVNVSDVYTALATNFGPNLVNFFYKVGDLYWVTLEGDDKYRQEPFELNNLSVSSSTGQTVAVNSMVNVKFGVAPDVIERFNSYLSAKIVVDPNPGYTISDVMTVISRVAEETLPHSYDFSWYNVSFQQQSNSNNSILAFAFGVLMIFLVLAAQFEMWRLPIVVVMGIPFALFGAGLILLMRGLNDDLYFQISLITLLGLSAKNSILITEFAIEHCRAGMNTLDAILMASRQRFRPIIMTSLAFILGALPLAFAHGANSNAEHSVGTGIIGGMLGSTIIATIFVPMFFVLIMGKKKLIREN